ncbi:MAG TPA: RNA polymerase sigma factor [Clostridia bacterium]|nr:RNA polymerase sigma factor [Clostridia bacterium]
MISFGTTAVDGRELVERIKRDKAAFLELYDTYFLKVYNYVFYRTFNQADAEELTSQTFLSALEHIDRYEYRNIPVGVWLFKIASNAVNDLYRKKGLTADWLETDSLRDENPLPETVVLLRVEKERLRKELQALPALQGQALILRYLYELSYQEISEIMDKSEGSVKQLLHRGLRNLRKRMVDHE